MRHWNDLQTPSTKELMAALFIIIVSQQTNKQKILILKMLWFKKLQSGKTIDDCLFLACSSERMKDHLFPTSSCYL